MDKFLGTLGLCKKAGRLIYGCDRVCEELEKGGCRGVILAGDISAKSEKEIRYACGRHDVRVVSSDAAMDDIKKVIGKRTGIIGITDAGFFDALAEKAARQT